MSIQNIPNHLHTRRPWPLSALAELPGAIVMRDANGAVMAVLFRGEHAGEQDVSRAENDAMQAAALNQRGGGVVFARVSGRNGIIAVVRGSER